MTDDTALPATKGDVSDMGFSIKQELREEIKAVGQELREEMRSMEDSIKRYFDLTVETIRHDLLGAKKDDIEVMKDRITRLERHTGLVPS